MKLPSLCCHTEKKEGVTVIVLLKHNLLQCNTQSIRVLEGCVTDVKVKSIKLLSYTRVRARTRGGKNGEVYIF